MSEKLKALIRNDQFFYSCLIIIVGLIAFGLGRLTAAPETVTEKPLVQVTETRVVPQPSNTADTRSADTQSALLIASKSGTKYHLSTCPGAKQIKQENKITFTSISEAEAAGYKPAANCPGLQ